MPRNITVTFDDGSTHVYQNTPDGVTPEQVTERAAKEFGKGVSSLDGGKKAGGSVIGDLAAGAVRGAGSIGATILAPVDAAARALNGGKPVNIGGYDIVGQDRRAGMDAGLSEMGADTNSLAFKAGKVGAEIAGTAGAGGAVANTVRAVAPGLTAAPVVANALRAVETAGAQGGGILSRSVGGAINGGISAGMINPEDAGAGAIIGGAAPSVLGLAGKAGSKIGSALRGAPAEPQRLAAARAAQEAGYVIPPSDIRQQGIVTEALGGLSGKIKTAQEASSRNAKVTTDLAKDAIGIPADQPLTREAITAVRKQAGQAYEAVRGAGTVTATPEYLKAIDKIGQEMQGASRSFPGLKRNDIADLVDTLKQPQFDAGDTIDAIRVLRDQADGLFAKGEKGAAKAYKAASEALEGALDKHLQQAGDAEGLKALRDARQLIAKTYTVEKALNGQTGEVSAQVLAQQLKRGKPLSGGLKTAAEAGEAFPKATQALKEAPKAVSPLDWAVGAMSGTATGNPLMLATLGARPLVRNALLSKQMQAYAARDVGPSVVSRLSTPENALILHRALPALAADR